MTAQKEQKVQSDVRQRADELHDQGLPYQMAMSVAAGSMDLSDALERMATKERVERLMKSHELSRALATQVAIGHADLGKVLGRRKLAKHRAEHHDRTCLVPGQRLAVMTHEGLLVKGEVLTNEAYAFSFRVADTPQEMRKLSCVYAYDASEWKLAKKAVRKDRRIQAKVVTLFGDEASTTGPATRPQDRFAVSDKRLFKAMDSAQEVSVGVLTGEEIRGTITWFGRYEFAVTTKNDLEVVVFRHALVQFHS